MDDDDITTKIRLGSGASLIYSRPNSDELPHCTIHVCSLGSIKLDTWLAKRLIETLTTFVKDIGGDD